MSDSVPTAETQLAAAMALHQRGDLVGAEAGYRAILASDPGNADALHLLGVALFQSRQHEEAIASIGSAIAFEAGKAEYFNNLSLPLRELGRPDEALAAATRAVELHPEYAEAHANRGLALMDLGKPGDAARSFERAIALKPGVAAFHNNLGNARRAEREYDAAEIAFREAVRLQPRHAQAHFGLGVALDAQKRRLEAVASLREAVRLKPDFAEAHRRLGAVLSHVGRLRDAYDAYDRALDLDPDDTEARAGIVFMMNYFDDVGPGDLFDRARAYAEGINAEAGAVAAHSNTRDPDRDLRIGFVSGDLGDAPVGDFTRNVFAAIDRRRFTLLAYNTKQPREPMHALFDTWRDIDRETSDAALAETIHADGVDILVDLSGFTSGMRARVFATKPAPVQALWLGYSGTSGNGRVDHVIADRQVIPPGEERFYAEAPWRMPDSYLCWSPPAEDVALAAPPVLSRGTITFGSFNNIRKLSGATVATWARILAAVPQSRLLIKTSRKMDPVAFEQVGAAMSAAGIEPRRVDLINTVPGKVEHFGHYNEVDIALDPFPYAGTTTTVEALWMGVPVITLAGEGFIARVGPSLLTTLGHPEWIASDRDDYVRRAVEMAADPAGLAAIRRALRGELLASPLCDAPLFARHLEQAFRGMWRRWCEDSGG